MSESQANFDQGSSEQEIRDKYPQAVDFTPGAELRAVTAFTFTAELRDIANEMRAHALMPVTHGLEFIEEHMREPGPHPAPSEVALGAIGRIGERLRAESEGTSATQDLPSSENR